MLELEKFYSNILPQVVSFVTSLVPNLMSTTSYWSNYFWSFFDKEPDADSLRTVPEIIESRGFKAETHTVTTSDGYILTLYRIINPFAHRMNIDTQPVLLGHGMGAHCAHWLINSDDGHLEPIRNSQDANNKKSNKKISNNLGFLLANMTYDVWLLNWRGSKYSMRHQKWSPKQPKFWDFCLDDCVNKDLPAFIDYILEKTGKSTLSYIGLSQGSVAMFGLLSTQPDYNNKIKPFIALAPAVKVSNAFQIPIPLVKWKIPIPGLIKIPILRLADYWLRTSNPGPLPLSQTLERTIAYIGSGNMFQYHLSRLLNLITSQVFEGDVNQNRLSVYAAQTNLTVSKKSIAHLLQTIIYDDFARFDYGDEKNEKVYGCVDPPAYELRNISNQTIAIIYGKNDQWIARRDINFITNNLKVPVLEEYLIPDAKWSHLDFTFSPQVGRMVNSKIVDILKRAEAINESDITVTRL